MAGRAPLAMLLSIDPPHHIWQGLQHLAFISDKVRENDQQMRDELERRKAGARGHTT